jgi:hypothetical protein
MNSAIDFDEQGASLLPSKSSLDSSLRLVSGSFRKALDG